MDDSDSHSVLIVDDDLDTCENLKQILELDGYKIDIANSVAEARNSRGWSEYVAIILDRRLPDGSADELLPEIKTSSPDTAVIIITGFPNHQVSLSAIRQRAEDMFLKPFDVDDLRASLAQIVRTRLAEQRAADAERLAMIGQTMAGIAHESRNAIQRIQTAVDMLKLDYGDVKLMMSEVTKIELANSDLKATLDEVRDYAAPMNLERSMADLSTVWKRAWKNVTSVGNNNAACLQEQAGEIDLQCNVDEYRLEQVFRNLFENSMAAYKGTPSMQISCVDGSGSNDKSLRIAIRDNGPGFAIVEPQRIFEPFFSTKQKGTGLGMAIVKRTIEAHGGRVAIGNNGHSGAEIVITMPRNLTAS